MKFNIILACGIFVLNSSPSSAVTPVRLVDGPHRYAGRLEVYYKGEWGSVCGDYFDEYDADVVCGMIRNTTIGLVNATVHQSSYYGYSSGPIIITNLRCNGSEDDIFFCKSSEWKSSQYCYYYYQNVGIDCNTQVRLMDSYGMGRVEILYNGDWGTVCNSNFDRNEAEVICRTMGLSSRNATYESYGYGPSYYPSYIVDCRGDEEDLSQCYIRDGYCSHSRDVKVECGDTNVQLFYGPNELHGRLVVMYHGTMLNFCADGFGPNEARVACKTINNGTEVPGTITRRYYGSSYFYQVNNLDCTGNESDISQCSSSSWGYSRCPSAYFVNLDCNTVRLIDAGNNVNDSGRLEVYSHDKDTWQTVCANHFYSNDARVVCRMLGYNRYPQIISGRYPRGHGEVMTQVLRCRGYENDISDCPSYTSSSCSHRYDVGLECNDNSGYFTHSYWLPFSTVQSEANLRLVNGNGHSGRVEVYYRDQWGTICDSNFDHNDVQVVCRSLGLYQGSSYGVAYYGAHFGEGDGNVVIEDLQCYGHEYHLSQCTSKTWLSNGCDHSRDVGVDCYAYSYGQYTTQGRYMISSGNYEGAIRLVNGQSSYSGRVEVFYNGQWGTICDDDFDRNDARVVCRVLGMNYGYEKVYPSAYFGSGNGPITIDDLQCNGNEWGLSQCVSRPWYSHNCAHSEDVGVDCYGFDTSIPTTTEITSSMPEGSVRLIGGSSNYGTVEVYSNGRWGTICDDSFDHNDVKVICRMLGHYYGNNYGVAYSNAHFGQGSGPITIDDLQCRGHESTIRQCNSSPWHKHNCGHSEDAGVHCSAYYTESTSRSLPWWYHTTVRPTSPAPTMDDIIYVNCDESGWNIRVNMYLLRELYPNAKASDIYLGENSCTGSQSWSSVTFNQGLRECLTSETIRDNVLVYSNELVYAERDPNYSFIIRHYNWTVGIECDVQRNESSSAHIHHDTNHLMEPQVTGSSHFAVNMSFYSDPNFMRQIYGNPLHVSVGDKVFVKVFTTTSDWSVKMRVHTCYTKPSQYAADYLKFFLIRNGCEVDSNTHLISQSAHESRFVFEDFEYASNHEGIYVFCDAVFCSSHDYSRQCQQTCNPIIRRKINVEKVEDVTAANTDVGKGDITIENKEDSTWDTTMANRETTQDEVITSNEETKSEDTTIKN